MAAVLALATLCLVAAVSLTAALTRRLPAQAMPVVFPLPAIAGILLLAAKDNVLGMGIAAATIVCAGAALVVASFTRESQLSPWWWRQFERDLHLSMAETH